MRIALFVSMLLLAACTQAQPVRVLKTPLARLALRQHWVDSVYEQLSLEERIGQLFMVAAYSGGPNYNAPKIEALIREHQVGGLIFMQGGPVRQAILTNQFQQMAQVPLLLSMDAEWGLGMRLDSVKNLPKQMTLGAANDSALAYRMGTIVGDQCKRLGVHVNFAPVVDVNNNPDNPVINARSFGEDKRKVARLASAYMRGLQDKGVMACAKHFPGHGDVSVDSHKDLPVINKSMAQLDTLELYPFKELIRAGVQSVMVAHLAVPALEMAEHTPTTLSKNTVTGLLKNEMGFKGLVFTDALDMKGVAKYFEPGEVDLRAFLAGNDVLLFSQDVPTGISKIKAALAGGKASMKDLEARVKKILTAKYNAELHHFTPIETGNIVNDLNQFSYDFNLAVAEKAITLVRDRNKLFPLRDGSNVLEIIIGEESGASAPGYSFKKLGYYASVSIAKGGSFKAAEDAMLKNPWDQKRTNTRWDAILVTVHGLSFYPGKSYGLDQATLDFLSKVARRPNVIVALMGNAYALKYVCDAGTMICGYEDTPWTNRALQEILDGERKPKGVLPVTPPCLQ